MFLFFSSRRRHTRLQGDWSSDVCSSDLLPRVLPRAGGDLGADASRAAHDQRAPARTPVSRQQIGRASCREREKVSVVGGTVLNTRLEEMREWQGEQHVRTGK